MPNLKNFQPASLGPKKISRHITATALLSGLLMTAQGGVASEQPPDIDDGPTYATGLTLGAFGAGASVNVGTNLSLIAGDKIQWRTTLSGIAAEDSSSEDFNGIDYEDIDLSQYALKTGVDWYPYRGGWADEIFFSAGLIYADSDLHGTADTSKSFTVGGVTVNPGDIESLETEIQHSGVLPYLSLGWGNKLTGKRGWDFQAEIGLAYQTSNTKVRVMASDPNGFLSDDDLTAEEREIEDDIDDLKGFASITLSYLF